MLVDVYAAILVSTYGEYETPVWVIVWVVLIGTGTKMSPANAKTAATSRRPVTIRDFAVLIWFTQTALTCLKAQT